MVATSEKTKGAEVVQVNLNDPALFINRELSMLEFQRRVLEEAQDESNPLLERVKFLSIVGSNLDEFFMVRVTGLRKQVDAGVVDVSADGVPPTRVLADIRKVISDEIMVLNFGTKIAGGKPSDIVRDQKVVEVYLGKEKGLA